VEASGTGGESAPASAAGRRGRPPIRSYWEQLGLLPPPARTAAGYRDYQPEAATRLGFVRAAQSIGLSLGEIREILAVRDRGQIPCAHVARLIQRHAAELAERIAALEQMRQDLERLARTARTVPPERLRHTVYCHLIETGVQPAAGSPT
jgi:MerR family transcriptional regulator, copper efflux regulator